MSPARKKTTKKAASRKTPGSGKTASRKKAAAPRKTTKKQAAAPAKAAKKKVSAAKKTAVKQKAPAKKKPLREKAAPKQPAAAAAPRKRSAKKATAAEKAADSKRLSPTKPAVPPPDAHPKLGVKHTCFRCGAKFYDLFRPEPLCPKCGADQREAPKVTPRSKPTPVRKRPSKRSMAPLLDDEEEDLIFDDDKETGMDLEAAGAELDDPAEVDEEDSDI